MRKKRNVTNMNSDVSQARQKELARIELVKSESVATVHGSGGFLSDLPVHLHNTDVVRSSMLEFPRLWIPGAKVTSESKLVADSMPWRAFGFVRSDVYGSGIQQQFVIDHAANIKRQL